MRGPPSLRVSLGILAVGVLLLCGTVQAAPKKSPAGLLAKLQDAVDGEESAPLMKLMPQAVAAVNGPMEARTREQFLVALWRVASCTYYDDAGDAAVDALEHVRDADAVWAVIKDDMPGKRGPHGRCEHVMLDVVEALRPRNAIPALLAAMKATRDAAFSNRLVRILGGYGASAPMWAEIVSFLMRNAEVLRPWLDRRALEGDRAKLVARRVVVLESALRALTGRILDLEGFVDLWFRVGRDPARLRPQQHDLRVGLASSDDAVLLDALDRIQRAGLPDADLRAPLEKAVANRDWRIAAMALRALAALDLEAVPPGSVLKRARARHWQVRLALAEGLGAYRSAEAVDALISLLGDKKERVRRAARHALVALTQQDHGRVQRSWVKWRHREGADLRLLPRKLRPHKARGLAYATSRPPARTTFFGHAIRGESVVFVLDKSDSMSWGKFDQVIAEVKAYVASAPPSTRFGVIDYAEKPRAWKDKLVAANRGNARNAEAFLKGSQPYGPTNVIDALRMALAMPNIDTVVLLSDGLPNRGSPSSPDAILQALQKENRHLRVAIHTLAVQVTRWLPYDAPRGDDKPPLTETERKRQEALRAQAPSGRAQEFLYEMALFNDGTFDLAFADCYRNPPGSGPGRPSTDK
jgi:hypothetical protein